MAKKKIILDFEKELGDDFKKWTKEAVEEFLDLFPEYKNNFEIVEKSPYRTFSKAEVEAVIATFKKNNPNSNSADSIWDLYNQLPDGTFELKNSIEYCVEKASTNGTVDLQKWCRLQGAGITNIDKNTPITIAITKRPTNLGFGVGDEATACISAGMCGAKEEYFKNIIIHELGHTFRATELGRKNIENHPTFGVHCTDDSCLMYTHAYQSESQKKLKARTAKGESPFCPDCTQAIREYMHKFFVAENVNVAGNQPSSPTPIADNVKEPYRRFFQNIAKLEGSTYKESTKSTDFDACLVRQNGDILSVKTNCNDKIALNLFDKDGKKKTPSVKDFNHIINLARSNGQIIDIAPTAAEEFKARLMIACMEANPPMPMGIKPKTDAEFLSKLESNTKSHLLALINKTQQQQQKPNQPNPKPSNHPNLDKTRNEKIAELERKEKLNTITAQEKHEWEYAKFDIERQAALEEAIERTGDENNPRTQEHTDNSGLEPKDYNFNSQNRKSVRAWKLHLDVVPNRKDSTTEEISDFLEDLDVEHKINSGGENGKGMTIYIGSYEDAQKLSKEINFRFGKDVGKTPIYADQKRDEMDFNKSVTGRFYLSGLFETKNPRGAIKGLCPTSYGSSSDQNSEAFIFAQAQKHNILPKETKFDDCVGTGDKDFHAKYVFEGIEAYCAHKVYTKHMGDFYHGRDLARFEERMFGDALPAVSSEERTSWDKIADTYVTHLDQEYPRGKAEMEKMVQEYRRIDFRNLQPAPQQNNNRNNNRGRK